MEAEADFFSKVKRLVVKWIGTRKRLFSSFLTARCDFNNARTFYQSIFYSSTHICIFAPVHKLLDYARSLGFGPILLQWRPNMWDFSATFAFCIKANGLATFFIAPKNCIFWGTSFEPIKKVASLFAQKIQGFNRNPLYHCYTLTRTNESCRTYEWVVSHVWTSHVTHANVIWRVCRWFEVCTHIYTYTYVRLYIYI